ncbi:HAD family hydrolase [Nonomuraea basaltis]|uniref:HAD family hydrolase n=1 Tax=Nonomuraea basaltis TaxID=2495887 RepID=UPI00110C62C3|nr:HAD family hydrolase [Nonomuraea basaltis]TMR97430.1 HAD family hydrolase [Nonomuraea basaltis]
MTGASGMRASAVVFDLDGTLVDTMMSVPTAYAGTIRALGGPAVTPEDVVAAWHLGSTPVVLAHFLGRPASAEDLNSFYRHLDVAVAAVRPFPGVADMIGALSRAGHPLGVFTSATRRATTLMLAIAGLAELFTVVVCGDEIGRPKPAPEGLELACRLLGVTATDAIYVGDADVDLECARRAGARGIHASWGVPAVSRTRSPLVARRPQDVIGLAQQPTGRPIGT